MLDFGAPQNDSIVNIDLKENQEYYDRALLTSFLINLGLLVILWIAFEFLRISRLKWFYSPRAHTEGSNINNLLKETEDSRSLEVFHSSIKGTRSPPLGLLGWIKPSLGYSETNMFITRGLDAVMYISFLRTCLTMLIFQFLVAMIIVIPVNVTGTAGAVGTGKLSIVNISPGSSSLYAHVLAVFCNSIIVYIFLYRTYAQYTAYRVRYRKMKNPANRCILLTEVNPKEGELEPTNQSLLHYFQELFPTEVLSARITENVSELSKVQKKRQNLVLHLERAKVYMEKTQKRLEVWDRPRILGGRSYDAIEYYLDRIADLDKEIALKQQKALLTNTAFVSFNSTRGATKCLQVQLCGTYNKFIQKPAPEERDLIWESLAVTRKQRLIRISVVSAITILLVAFYMAPISFISGLANLKNLSEDGLFKWLAPVSQSQAAALLQGFVPSVILIIFMNLAVPILGYLSNQEKYHSKSEKDLATFSKYFLFHINNVYLGVLFTGTLFSLWYNIGKDMISIEGMIHLISISLPQRASFYISYIMVQSLVAFPLLALRLGPLIISVIKLTFIAKCQRDYKEIEKPPTCPYYQYYASDVVIFIITLSYSTLSPLILPFGLIYFGLGYTVLRYMVVYVYAQEFEGGGKYWPAIFHRFCFGLLLYQLLMIGEFSLKQFSGGSICSILVVATLLFWYLIPSWFGSLSEYGPLDAFPASDDDNDHDMKISSRDYVDEEETYIPPLMKRPEEVSSEIQSYRSSNASSLASETSPLL